MFSKEEYWKRRHNTYTVTDENGFEISIERPMRGQTDTLVGKSFFPRSGLNRAMRRRRVIDRSFTKKGFEYGLRIGSKKYNKIHWLAKVQSEG